MPVKKKVAQAVSLVKSRIEAAKQGDPEQTPWVKQVAMLTGVLAAMSGFLDVRSTTITNEAVYSSNQAILAQTEASDSWTEYQADSIKARIVETAMVGNNLKAGDKNALMKDDQDLRDRQAGIKQHAQAKEQEREQHLKDGLKYLGEKDLLGYAGLSAQLGIALASVAALVRWRLPFIVGICAGAAGALIAAFALLSQYGALK
jgi:hypothetical protein